MTTATAASEAIKGINSSFEEFAKHAGTLKSTSADNIKALKALLSRIEKIEAPNDMVVKRLDPAIEAMRLVASRKFCSEVA